MGCAVSADTKRNRVLDEQIQKDKEKLRKENKILLLGAGDSGKSTIVKQMKIIHENGFTREQKLAYRLVVHNNAVSGLQTILLAMPKIGIAISPQHLELYKELIKVDAMDLTATELKPPLDDQVKRIWAVPEVQSAFVQGHGYHLCDSAKYYLDEVERLASPDYVPSDQDILRTRSRTTGIVETRFPYKNLNFRMVDVGGQRSERKKWIHCFENVTAILFCVALSAYDARLFEDEKMNQMTESLNLFDSICNSNWFEKTSVILFLNKTDVFRERIKLTPLTVCFPDYKGGSSSQKGMEFIRSRYERLSKGKKTIYSHFTCATNTENIRFVFEVVTDIIIQDQLRFYKLV